MLNTTFICWLRCTAMLRNISFELSSPVETGKQVLKKTPNRGGNNRVEKHFKNNDACSMWRQIKGVVLHIFQACIATL